MYKYKDDLNKIVLITGASSGIGQATAFRFAQAGYQIVITYNKNKTGAEQTQKKCLQLGAQNVSIFHLDLLDDSSIKNTFQNIIDKYKKIDILINNAGEVVCQELKDMGFEVIEQQIRTNLEGVIKITKICLPYIQESIANIGSNLGLFGGANLTIYSASKFGLRGFTKSLAREIPQLKIYTVNPGLTAIARTNFKGLAVHKVAEIIFKAATGQYRAKSGSDINIKDYQFGENLKNIIIFLRYLKRILKTF